MVTFAEEKMKYMKVELKVQDLLQRASNDKYYIALLREKEGTRSLPILVGLLEAQAIAMYLKEVSTERPMLHDLLASMANAFDICINEVYIYKVQNGVFYSYLVCEQHGQAVNVDARTSDAIAIALHQGRPVDAFWNGMESINRFTRGIMGGDHIQIGYSFCIHNAIQL